jgi:hypothetical protein
MKTIYIVMLIALTILQAHADNPDYVYCNLVQLCSNGQTYDSRVCACVTCQQQTCGYA